MRCRGFVAAVVWGWCWLGPMGPSAAEAQMQAMPLTIADAEEGCPVDAASVPAECQGGSATTRMFEEFRELEAERAQGGPVTTYQLPSTLTAPASSPRGLLDMNVQLGPAVQYADYWSWQLLPEGLIYRSYLAGTKEPRLASYWVYDRGQGWLWDATLGGRVGLLRYGSRDSVWPEGWQLDVEGAAFPRMTLDEERDRDLVSADFRAGVPLTYRRGRWEGKLAYYHLSAHLADEYLVAFPDAVRINYVRDAIVLGVAVWPLRDLRLYSEAGWAFKTDGGSEPWEFQFGADYAPSAPTGPLGAPFLAVGGHLRQEVDYGGTFTGQAGWAWRGQSGHLFRVGAHYLNGKSNQYQFFSHHEEQIGAAIWYDF
jgi:hypothetical protein